VGGSQGTIQTARHSGVSFIFMKSTSDYASYDDERLIRLIAQSREEALTQLYDRYHRLVFSLALAIVNDRATAEEITLDVFMRVWQKAGTYRADQAKVSTWLTHIARHHAIDILRRRSVRLDQYAVHWEDITFEAQSIEQDPQESAEVSLRRQRVHAALAQLPADQRQALFLAYFSGLTHSEIAEALNQPLGTIKTRLRLAVQKLRTYLSNESVVADTSIEPESAYNISEEE
jgi:RNA polymerase sigma-70 factor, ECF subfamily